MKLTTLIAAAVLLALPLTAQTADPGPNRDQTRKQDGTGTGTAQQSQLRKRDGSCGNTCPTGSRGAGQGSRAGQGRGRR